MYVVTAVPMVWKGIVGQTLVNMHVLGHSCVTHICSAAGIE